MQPSANCLTQYTVPPYGRNYCTIPKNRPLTPEQQMIALKGSKKMTSKVNAVYDLLRQEN